MPVYTGETTQKFGKKRLILIGAVLVMATAGIIGGMMLVGKPQDIRERAAELSCPEKGASCQWDEPAGLSDSATYTVVVEKKTGDTYVPLPGSPFTKKKTDPRIIMFTPEAGSSYRCTVTVNDDELEKLPPECQPSSNSDEITCSGNVTPTLSPTPTSSIPTPSAGVTTSTTPTAPTSVVTNTTSTPSALTPTSSTQSSSSSSSSSPTPITTAPSGSPTKTPTSGANPTPTSITIVSASNTPSPSPTSGVTTLVNEPSSSTPTTTSLPRAGLWQSSVIILAFGMLVVFLGVIL